ncbi:MAG: bifunctional 3-phenylpropionate/cinnamic acid dioxygenase ferredoxin subunit [Actinomycetota bacterium]
MTAYTLFELDRLAPEEALKVTIDGREIALVRIDDDVYAIGDTCSHQDVSLSEGFVEADDCAIECPKHGALFDLRTGDALSLPATRPIPTYDVAVVDGDVVLTLAAVEEDA